MADRATAPNASVAPPHLKRTRWWSASRSLTSDVDVRTGALLQHRRGARSVCNSSCGCGFFCGGESTVESARLDVTTTSLLSVHVTKMARLLPLPRRQMVTSVRLRLSLRHRDAMYCKHACSGRYIVLYM